MVETWIVAHSATLRRGLRSLLEEGGHTRLVGEGNSLESLDWGTLEVLIFAGPLELGWTRSDLPPRVYLLEPDEPLPPLEPGVALLHSDADALELAAAIVAVAQGLCVLSPAPLEKFSSDPLPTQRRPTLETDLTPREREVLELLSQGLPNKTIAKRLSISEHTVKFHLGQVFFKLEVSSRAEAVGVAVRNGLVAL